MKTQPSKFKIFLKNIQRGRLFIELIFGLNKLLNVDIIINNLKN